jgi:hypothetical protein
MARGVMQSEYRHAVHLSLGARLLTRGTHAVLRAHASVAAPGGTSAQQRSPDGRMLCHMVVEP